MAAEGSGINTDYYKLAAFGLGAAWAGMAGTLFAAKMTIISPESFSFWESVVLFMIGILGGAVSHISFTLAGVTDSQEWNATRLREAKSTPPPLWGRSPSASR